MNSQTNRWSVSYSLTLAPGARGGVAIDFGYTNNPPGIRVVASVSSAELLNAGHRLRVIEDANVSNTNDPERGYHRDRSEGDGLPAWQATLLGMSPDDIYLFHAPGTFTQVPGGAELWYGDGNASAPANSGEWLLAAGPTPRYDVIEVENLDPTHTTTFVLTLNYQFVKP